MTWCVAAAALVLAGLTSPAGAQPSAPDPAVAALRAEIEALRSEQRWTAVVEVSERLAAVGEARNDLALQAEGWLKAGLASAQLRALDEARDRFLRALQIQITRGDRAAAAAARLELGLLAWRQGDGPATRAHYAAAAEDFAAAGQVVDQAMALRSLTFAADMTNAERLAVLSGAWALVETLDAPRAQGLILHHQADNLNLGGDYARAVEVLDRALPLLEAHGTPTQHAQALTSLGRSLRLHGQVDRAVEVYRRVLTTQEASGNTRDQAQTWDAIGIAYWSDGRDAEALAANERAVELAGRADDPRLEAAIALSLALKLIDLGHGARAAEVVATVFARPVSPDLESAAHRARAELHRLAGRLDEARADAERSVEGAERLERQEDLVWALQGRARVREAQGDAPGAAGDVERALDLLEQLRAKAAPRDAMKRAFVTQHLALFTQGIELQAGLGRADDALETAERARARAFQDLLATRRLLGPETGGASTDDLPSSVTVPAVTRETLVETVRAVGTTLLAYWVGPKATTVWVVRPDGRVTTARVAVDAAELVALARQVAAGIAGPARGAADEAGVPAAPAPAIELPARSGTRVSLGRDPRPVLRRLHALLVTPVAGHLPTEAGALVTVVPHGPLFGVPFAALLDGSGRYLVERYRLHVTPAAALLEAGRPTRPAGPVPALFVADPVPMPRAANATLARLPGARAEAQAIARLFGPGQAHVLIGSDATKARVREAAAGRAVIHLATHGLVFDDRPFDSFLALADRAGEGPLAAGEIYGLELDADLVVLSACRTASGLINGDGVVGLARAFFYAGATSVVASLWDLPDAPMLELMPAFYRSWLKHGDKAAALRDGQLALIRALRRGRVRVETPLGPVTLPEHPALWAGVVLIGQP